MKSSRAGKKRFRKTGTGKIRRNQSSFKSHILTKKPRKRTRKLRQTGLVASVDVPRVKKMIMT